METHPFVRDAASHFPQKLRSQLLLEGRALKQSAGGGSERRGGNGGDDWSHSDIGTVPPLHPHLLRPRHWGGGVHLRPELQFQFHCPVAVRTFFLSPQSLYLVLELIFTGTPLYPADRFTGDHTMEATYRAQLSSLGHNQATHVGGQLETPRVSVVSPSPPPSTVTVNQKLQTLVRWCLKL